MTSDYQRRKGKYILPTAVYHQTIWQIRDYYRLKELRDEILEGSAGPPDGMPGGNRTGDPTQAKALRLAETGRLVGIIDNALEGVPEEYRRGVWRSVMYREPYPRDADRSTYTRWKSYFVYTVAKNLHLI